ncbi:transcriptional activator HlyU [Psychromonas marina]|uniref:Transcriptional activator HlyU n=1 Tax=Psychromonas marina TaxID=88364 RepID=A0ABQ6DW59_9GAMM|nr:HlyU family transcriptional regulator [Psychromonas marina]GLS89205.1 transcriptional activator HlyU [Psychromonas marina]
MGFFSGLKSLFLGDSSGSAKTSETIKYNDFSIIPAPIREGGQYRVAGTITKGEGEALKTHKFIRSDVIDNRDECISLTIRKAKLAIDQSEDRIFN